MSEAWSNIENKENKEKLNDVIVNSIIFCYKENNYVLKNNDLKKLIIRK